MFDFLEPRAQLDGHSILVTGGTGSFGKRFIKTVAEHYKPSQVAAKAQAGFTIYAPASQTGRLSAALEERGVIAEILSL